MSLEDSIMIPAPVPQSRLRLLPIIDLSPPPEYCGTMQDLMPAPLRARSKSPHPERPVLGKWESFSTRERTARSKSPQGERLPAHIRARTPELVRSRTPESLYPQTPKTPTAYSIYEQAPPPPMPRYNLIPSEYLPPSPKPKAKASLRQKFSHSRSASASSTASTSTTGSKSSIGTTRSAPALRCDTLTPTISRGRPIKSIREPVGLPRLELPALPLPQLTLQPPTARTPRRRVPSMIDYLSMEQLENLWQSQDAFAGPVNVPQKPASPPWRSAVADPRSPTPLLDVGRGLNLAGGLDIDRLRAEMGLVPESELGIHPALRDRSPFQTTFTATAF